MQTFDYVADTYGNKAAMLNMTESKILNFWLNETSEKRNTLNMYFAKFMYEISTDNIRKNELQSIINELENVDNKDSEFVAYTTNGKGLTRKEYTEMILLASDEANKGINLIEHSEVEKRINEKIAKYESNLA